MGGNSISRSLFLVTDRSRYSETTTGPRVSWREGSASNEERNREIRRRKRDSITEPSLTTCLHSRESSPSLHSANPGIPVNYYEKNNFRQKKKKKKKKKS